jgi:hypothetical protein
MGASFKLTKRSFSKEVLDYQEKHKCNTIDAVLHLCETHRIDPETVKGLLTPDVRERLDFDFQKLNLRPKPRTLPVRTQ